MTATQEHVAALLLLRKKGPSAGPPEESLVLRVAYENASQAAFLVRHGRTSHADAIHRLRYVLPTERARAEAQEDPCFDGLHGELDFQELVQEPPGTFMGLPVSPARPGRSERAAELVLRTGSDQQRGEPAENLGRPQTHGHPLSSFAK
ncbi:hypothetical protein [Streptomyces fulvoviolaceus]|uniref:hypothetical protein n=1 Tax=Streptomyces fulvoviolaceus TaxID=285535 RepID=UPI00131C60F4|nr:hypothetical protein [Streptomyces fulvoviolaceus]